MTYYEYMNKYAAKKKTGYGIINQGMFASGLGSGIGYAVGRRLVPRQYSLLGGTLMAIAGADIAAKQYNKKHDKDINRYNRGISKGTIKPKRSASILYPLAGFTLGTIGTNYLFRKGNKILNKFHTEIRKQQVLDEARRIISRGLKHGMYNGNAYIPNLIISKYAQQSYGYIDAAPHSYVDQANVEDIRNQLLKKYKMDTLKGRALTTAAGLGTGAGMGMLYGKYREAAGKALKHRGGIIGGLALLGGIGANKIFSVGQSILKNYMGAE